MIDQRNKNTMVVTGTPTLTAGALLLDTNQALTFNGSTNSYAAADSTSLSITSSLSLELFVRFTSLPGSTKNILSKASSYAVQLNSSGKLLFRLDNGASNVTVTSNATLSTNTWYHIVCVYNDGYAGAQQFGATSAGSDGMVLDDDNGNNKLVGTFTLQESAILNSITPFIQYFDEIWDVQVRAVIYTDLAGEPDDLVTTSEIQSFTQGTLQWQDYSDPPTFPLTPVVVPAGTYHLGLITDTLNVPFPKAPVKIAATNGAGTVDKRPDSISSPSDPFGSTVIGGTQEMSIYCDYTAIARTGLEGKAAVYINGALDNSAAYTADIADNANSLIIATDFAGSVDEVSVWNRVLSQLEIATHYLAR